MHVHSFCFVITRSVYLFILYFVTLIYFQNKRILSDNAKINSRLGGDLQEKFLNGGDCTKKVESHWFRRSLQSKTTLRFIQGKYLRKSFSETRFEAKASAQQSHSKHCPLFCEHKQSEHLRRRH